MPEKILYYLGAGASAKALPLARTVWKQDVKIAEARIPGLAYELEHFDFKKLLLHVRGTEEAKFFDALKLRFTNLAVKANEFGDVDTFAKYLHLWEPDGIRLQELKHTLSLYFALKQIILEAKDDRYLPWLISIMNTRRFPENVKVLSWNYDFQIELAAAQLGELEDVEHRGTSFTYSPSTLSYFPNLDSTFSDFKDLSLIHLNGIAGFTKVEERQSGSIFQKVSRPPKGAAFHS